MVKTTNTMILQKVPKTLLQICKNQQYIFEIFQNFIGWWWSQTHFHKSANQFVNHLRTKSRNTHTLTDDFIQRAKNGKNSEMTNIYIAEGRLESTFSFSTTKFFPEKYFRPNVKTLVLNFSPLIMISVISFCVES